MTNLQNQINNYLEYCQNQKRLDSKTLKAYRIDLKQFHSGIPASETAQITSEIHFFRNKQSNHYGNYFSKIFTIFFF